MILKLCNLLRVSRLQEAAKEVNMTEHEIRIIIWVEVEEAENLENLNHILKREQGNSQIF